MKKKAIIIISVVIAVIIAVGAVVGVLVVKNKIGDSNTQTANFEFADNQQFSYDGQQVRPIINNLSEEEKKRIVYSYSVNRDDNPNDDNFVPGLPVNVGSYYIKAELDGAFKIASVTVAPADVQKQELSVIYNQPFTLAPGYFTSEFDINDIEFTYLFVANDVEVPGTVILDADQLSPSVSTYAYTFKPSNSNYAEYRGSIDIRVFVAVSYYKNDALDDYDEVEYGSHFDIKNITQNIGYDVPYWEDIEHVRFSEETIITDDISVYYHEDILHYNIIYHLDGGTNTNPLTYTYEDETIILSGSSKPGYEFLGWFDSDEEEANEVTKIQHESTGDVELYAKFSINTYNITYHLDEGFNSENNPLTIKVTDHVILEDATKTGYNFLGWFEGEEQVEVLDNIARNLILLARFEIATFTLKFDSMGGSATPDIVAEYQEDITLDKNILLPGYEFVNWYRTTAFNDEDLFKETKMPAENITLYARYKLLDYPITYEVYGGVNGDNPYIYNINSSFTLNDASKVGATFEGWYLEDTFDTQITNIENRYGNLTLYAKFNNLKYQISFNVDGGTPIESVLAEYEEEISLQDAEKNGYEFQGWFKDSGFTQAVPSTYIVTGNQELFAKFEIETYHISYVLNDGVNDVNNPTSYTVETDTITLLASSKLGHTFQGWFDNAGGLGSAITTIPQGSTGAKTFYAKFAINHYTVTLDSDGGNSIAPIDAVYNETVNLPTPEKTGYTFVAWYLGEEPHAESITVVDNIALVARYDIINYAINYELNGGSAIGNPSSYNVESADIVLIDASKDYYTFNGWYDNSEFEGDPVTGIAHGSTGIKNFYAKFTPISYDITYNYNGGSATSNPASYTVESDTIVLENTSKTGYTFDGWYLEDTFDNKVTQIVNGSHGAVELFAKFTIINYAINYELNGGSATSNPVSYTIESVTIVLADTSKDYYTFNGWYDNSEFEGSPVTEIAHGSTGVKNFYAKFTPVNYSITYNLNGGVATSNPVSYTVESDAIVLENTSKTGYTFDGWFGNPGFTGSAVTEIAHGSHGAVELFAKFTIINYTITYNLDGGTNAVANPANYNVETATIILQDASKVGYTFIGWYLEDTYDNEVTEIAHGSTGAKVLYANFVANINTPYTVRHLTEKLDGTYELNSEETEYGTTDTNTAAEFKSIAHFTPVGSVEQVNINGDGSTVVVLRYSRDSYNVTFEYQSGLPTELIPANQIKSVKYGQEVGQFPAGLSVAKYSYVVKDNLDNDVLTSRVIENTTTFYVVYTLRSLSIEYHNVPTPIATAEAEAGDSVTLASSSKTGYDFIGWATELNGAKVYDGGETITMPSDSLDLYAVWSIQTYNIIYNLDGGTNNANNPASYNVETATITLLDATKTGYTFGGWYLEDTFNNEIQNITIGSTGNVEVFAKFTIDNYSITYNLDGGTNDVNNPASYNVEAATIALQDANKNGYTFDGWYLEDTFDNEITEIANGSTGAQVLYAKFSAINYAINYVLYNGTNAAGNPSSYTIESATITLQSATKNGYTFDGWYLESTFDNKVTQIVQGSTGAKTFYAKFSTINYTITYNLDGGTNAVANPGNYNVETATIALQEASKNGYTFDGWYSESTFENEVTQIPQGSTGNLALYAKFVIVNYNITYVLNDGTNNANNPDSYTVESATISLLAATKNGYTFNGWYDNSGFTGSAVTEIVHGSTGAETFYAKFTIIDYAINYVLNGGSATSNPVSYNIESATIVLANTSKDYYTFNGWYDNSGFTGSAITEIAHGSTGAKTFYAKFTPVSYTITYNLNGGTNNVNNPTSYNIESATFTLSSATKNGYTFDGWYRESAFNNKVTQIANGSHGNIELYAKFTAVTYTITYNLNNGTNAAGNPANYTVETATITLQDASKAGYSFVGWYRENTYQNKVTQVPQGSTGNITLYAKFNPVNYTITYNLNGGTNASGNPANYNIETNTFTLLGATKNGYTFDGWYRESTFNNQVTQVTKGSTGNITLYAKYSVVNYSITYNLYGGTNAAGNPATYTINDSITLLDPTKEECTFVGWYEDSTFNTPITTISGRTGNINLFARFDAAGVARHTITYVLNGGTNNANNPSSFTKDDASFTLLDPTKGNAYTFAGWFLESTFTTRIITVDTDDITEDIIVYAKWTPLQYTILYYDGSERITSLTRNTYTVEDSFTFETYSKFNHTFNGWYTDSGLTTPKTGITVGSTGTLRLYAKTTDKGFTVKFYDTDKTTLLDTKVTSTYGSISAPAYSYNSATYHLSWVDSAGKEIDFTRVDGNYNLHAQLVVISYSATIYFVDADGYAASKTGNTSITSTSATNKSFGDNISLTRQMRVTDASAYDLFYMSPVSSFDWALAVASISTNSVATASDGSMAAYVTVSGTTGTLSIFVFCIQPVAIITGGSQTLAFSQNLDMSTSTYQFYATIDAAFEAFAVTSGKLMRIYGRYAGALSGNAYGASNTTINSASATVAGVSVTRPKLIYQGSDVVLHNSYTINGNIILPYTRKCEDTTGYALKTTTAQSAAVISAFFAIDQGVTVTLKKTLTVGAEYYSGGTLYGRGVMMNNGTIIQDSGSTVNGFGFLKGTGNLVVNSGATLVDFFKIYDWPGGTNALSLYNENVFPFEVYSFHNVSCDTRIYAGATYKAWNQLYMASSFVADYITLVGTGGLFSLTSGYVDKSIKETTSVVGTNTNYASSNQNQTVKDVLDIHGNFTDNSISITVKATLISKTVTTSTSMAMPLGFVELTISEGSSTMSKNSYKFLPGSKLIIGRNATVTISNGVKIIFYDEYPDDYVYTQNSANKSGVDNTYSYQNKHSAIYNAGAIKDGYHPELIVNGTLIVKGNLGGKISTTAPTGSVNLSNTSATLPKVTELSYDSSSASASNETINASIYLFNGSTFAWADASATTYASIEENGAFGFIQNTNARSITLTYHVAGETSSTTINVTEDYYALTEGDLPNVERDGYTFDGWFMESGYTTPALGYSISTNANVYAKLTPIVYNIEYHTFIIDDYDDSQSLVNANPTYFTLAQGVSLQEAECGDLTFYGWFVDDKFSINAPNINASSFTYYKMLLDGTNTIHLYGYFSSIKMYSIVYRDDQTGMEIESIEAQSVPEGTSITFASALANRQVTEGVDTSLYAYDLYTFSKWAVFNSKGTLLGQYNPGTSYTPTCNINVVPVYVKSATYVSITPGSMSNASYIAKVGGSQVGSSSTKFYVAVGTSVVYTITYNESDSNQYSYVPASGSTQSGSGTSVTITANYNATMSASSVEGSCIVKGTMITLADGTVTEVENINAGDLILVFNHETGEYDVSVVMFNDAEEIREQTIINLFFSNGAYVGVVSEHGFFDLDLMEYVYITADNYSDYVGHRFYAMDGETILEDAYLTVEEVEVYSPVTAVHLNLFTNGILSMPGGVPGLFNIFEYGDDLKYDEEKMNADIEEYGLLGYEFFEDMIPYDVYIAFNGQYLGIAMAKGILTEENLAYYVERYSKFW